MILLAPAVQGEFKTQKLSFGQGPGSTLHFPGAIHHRLRTQPKRYGFYLGVALFFLEIPSVCSWPSFQGHCGLQKFLKLDLSGAGHWAGMASCSLYLHRFTSEASATTGLIWWGMRTHRRLWEFLVKSTVGWRAVIPGQQLFPGSGVWIRGPFNLCPASAPLHHCRPVRAEVRASVSVHEIPRIKNELVFRNLRARGFHFVCVIYLMCLLLQACRLIGHHLAATLV